MSLTLLVGPANAGKVALLLERYLEALPREPFLIVPNRSDVERAERDLLELQPILLSGSIGTFDDLFDKIARGGGRPPRETAPGGMTGRARPPPSPGRAGASRGPGAGRGGGVRRPADLDGDLA